MLGPDMPSRTDGSSRRECSPNRDKTGQFRLDHVALSRRNSLERPSSQNPPKPGRCRIAFSNTEILIAATGVFHKVFLRALQRYPDASDPIGSRNSSHATILGPRSLDIEAVEHRRSREYGLAVGTSRNIACNGLRPIVGPAICFPVRTNWRRSPKSRCPSRTRAQQVSCEHLCPLQPAEVGFE